MEVFTDILKVYGKLSGCRFTDALTASKFCKLAMYSGMENEKITKNDYNLIFTKILRNSADQRNMDFYEFIKAFEVLSARLHPTLFDPKNKLPAVAILARNIKN